MNCVDNLLQIVSFISLIVLSMQIPQIFDRQNNTDQNLELIIIKRNINYHDNLCFSGIENSKHVSKIVIHAYRL